MSKIKKKIAPPSYLGKIASEHWKFLMSSLIKDERLETIDLGLLEMACVSYADFREAEDLRERKQAISTYEKIMSAFEATPKARRGSKNGEYEDLNDIADFLTVK